MSQLAIDSSGTVLDRLSHVSARRGGTAAGSLAERLIALDRWVKDDLRAFGAELDAIPRGARTIHKAAHHLLDLRGKHLRPLCVALTSKLGAGFTQAARDLAVAVELVHSATLLHDDVVDLATTRRGKPTAAVEYGNAASIFAGDWLLIAALRKIRHSGVDVLDKMLAVIDEMIVAESVQLERRGKIAGAREDYFAIVEGKTAALFRWAMIAGARAAELPAAAETALERYGLHLGVAFQAVDDELDYAESGTGKDALADLREGKVTFPLVVALERDAALRGRLEALMAAETVTGDDLAGIANQVRASGALAATRSLAEEHVQRALMVLDELPAGAARDALVTVALASLERQS